MKQIVWISLLSLLFACNQTHEKSGNMDNAVTPVLEYPYTIDLLAAMENNVDFSLSDFGDSIYYVALRGLPEAPIVAIWEFEYSGDDLIVNPTHKQDIMRFNKNGELLNRIGRYGNGPGELLPGSRMSLSPEEKLVCVHRNYTHNELYFTYDGDLTDKSFYDKRENHGRTIPISANRIVRVGRLIRPPHPIPPDMYEVALFNSKDEEICAVPIVQKENKEWRSGPIVMTGSRWYDNSPIWYKDKLQHFAKATDTIYEISRDTIQAKYFLDKGDYHPGPSRLKLIDKSPYGDPEDYIYNECVFESDHYLLCRAAFKGHAYMIRFNKKTLDLQSMEKINGAWIGQNRRNETPDIMIQNDVDGGVAFYPHFTNRLGNVWICTYTALDYREAMEEKSENGEIDLTDQSLAPVRLYHSITEEDNPILMFLRLKK